MVNFYNRFIAHAAPLLGPLYEALRVNSLHLGVDYTAMAVDQLKDMVVQVLRIATTGLRLQEVVFQGDGDMLLCDVSTSSPCLVVPAGRCHRDFDAVHAHSHPGFKALVKLVGGNFWPGLHSDVKGWVASCVGRQCAEVHWHTKAPLEPFLVPGRRFDHVNVDLVGPISPSKGFTYLLTMVDRTTRLFEAVPLSSATSVNVAYTFISTSVARFG